MSFCSKCGLKNPDESQFCTNCGNPLIASAGDVNTEAVQNEADTKQPEPRNWFTEVKQGSDRFAWGLVAATVANGLLGLLLAGSLSAMVCVGFLLIALNLWLAYKDSQLISASGEGQIKKKEIACALIPFVYLFIRASRTKKKATPAFASLAAMLMFFVINLAGSGNAIAIESVAVQLVNEDLGG